MKTEKRIVKKEVEIYIADDGKEFSDHWSCEEYEEEDQIDHIKMIGEKTEWK